MSLNTNFSSDNFTDSFFKLTHEINNFDESAKNLNPNNIQKITKEISTEISNAREALDEIFHNQNHAIFKNPEVRASLSNLLNRIIKFNDLKDIELIQNCWKECIKAPALAALLTNVPQMEVQMQECMDKGDLETALKLFDHIIDANKQKERLSQIEDNKLEEMIKQSVLYGNYDTAIALSESVKDPQKRKNIKHFAIHQQIFPQAMKEQNYKLALRVCQLLEGDPKAKTLYLIDIISGILQNKTDIKIDGKKADIREVATLCSQIIAAIPQGDEAHNIMRERNVGAILAQFPVIPELLPILEAASPAVKIEFIKKLASQKNNDVKTFHAIVKSVATLPNAYDIARTEILSPIYERALKEENFSLAYAAVTALKEEHARQSSVENLLNAIKQTKTDNEEVIRKNNLVLINTIKLLPKGEMLANYVELLESQRISQEMFVSIRDHIMQLHQSVQKDAEDEPEMITDSNGYHVALKDYLNNTIIPKLVDAAIALNEFESARELTFKLPGYWDAPVKSLIERLMKIPVDQNNRHKLQAVATRLAFERYPALLVHLTENAIKEERLNEVAENIKALASSDNSWGPNTVINLFITHLERSNKEAALKESPATYNKNMWEKAKPLLDGIIEGDQGGNHKNNLPNASHFVRLALNPGDFVSAVKALPYVPKAQRTKEVSTILPILIEKGDLKGAHLCLQYADESVRKNSTEEIIQKLLEKVIKEGLDEDAALKTAKENLFVTNDSLYRSFQQKFYKHAALVAMNKGNEEEAFAYAQNLSYSDSLEPGGDLYYELVKKIKLPEVFYEKLKKSQKISDKENIILALLPELIRVGAEKRNFALVQDALDLLGVKGLIAVSKQPNLDPLLFKYVFERYDHVSPNEQNSLLQNLFNGALESANFKDAESILKMRGGFPLTNEGQLKMASAYLDKRLSISQKDTKEIASKEKNSKSAAAIPLPSRDELATVLNVLGKSSNEYARALVKLNLAGVDVKNYLESLQSKNNEETRNALWTAYVEESINRKDFDAALKYANKIQPSPEETGIFLTLYSSLNPPNAGKVALGAALLKIAQAPLPFDFIQTLSMQLDRDRTSTNILNADDRANIQQVLRQKELELIKNASGKSDYQTAFDLITRGAYFSQSQITQLLSETFESALKDRENMKDNFGNKLSLKKASEICYSIAARIGDENIEKNCMQRLNKAVASDKEPNYALQIKLSRYSNAPNVELLELAKKSDISEQDFNNIVYSFKVDAKQSKELFELAIAKNYVAEAAEIARRSGDDSLKVSMINKYLEAPVSRASDSIAIDKNEMAAKGSYDFDAYVAREKVLKNQKHALALIENITDRKTRFELLHRVLVQKKEPFIESRFNQFLGAATQEPQSQYSASTYQDSYSSDEDDEYDTKASAATAAPIQEFNVGAARVTLLRDLLNNLLAETPRNYTQILKVFKNTPVNVVVYDLQQIFKDKDFGQFALANLGDVSDLISQIENYKLENFAKNAAELRNSLFDFAVQRRDYNAAIKIVNFAPPEFIKSQISKLLAEKDFVLALKLINQLHMINIETEMIIKIADAVIPKLSELMKKSASDRVAEEFLEALIGYWIFESPPSSTEIEDAGKILFKFPKADMDSFIMLFDDALQSTKIEEIRTIPYLAKLLSTVDPKVLDANEKFANSKVKDRMEEEIGIAIHDTDWQMTIHDTNWQKKYQKREILQKRLESLITDYMYSEKNTSDSLNRIRKIAAELEVSADSEWIKTIRRAVEYSEMKDTKLANLIDALGKEHLLNLLKISESDKTYRTYYRASDILERKIFEKAIRENDVGLALELLEQTQSRDFVLQYTQQLQKDKKHFFILMTIAGVSLEKRVVELREMAKTILNSKELEEIDKIYDPREKHGAILKALVQHWTYDKENMLPEMMQAIAIWLSNSHDQGPVLLNFLEEALKSKNEDAATKLINAIAKTGYVIEVFKNDAFMKSEFRDEIERRIINLAGNDRDRQLIVEFFLGLRIQKH